MPDTPHTCRHSRPCAPTSPVRGFAALVVALAAGLVGGAARAQPGAFSDVTPTQMRDPFSWGEGAAWGDADGDGDLDLLVSNEGQRLRLHRNDGGTFASVTDFGFGNWTGLAWCDYDNDGDLDFLAAQAEAPKHLFRNDGTGFVDVTSGDLVNMAHTHGVAWADVDLDGDVDLVLANAESGNRLYRNDGADVFADVTPPVLDDPQYGRGCAFADYDLDGDSDLLVTNFGTSRLYRNDGGAFADVTVPPLSDFGHAGGVAWGDADQDGDFDLAIAKAFSASSRVYRNDGGVFADLTPAGFAVADTAVGIAWVDVDLDADLDLFVGAFHGNRLFRNDGGFAFVDVATGPLATDLDAHGIAWADYDADGDLDVYFATYYGRTDMLLRNDLPAGRHWLALDLVGTFSNRSAVGARVEVVTGALRQVRQVAAGEGYNSMNALRVHVGLGDAAMVDSIVVRWPSGIVQDTAGVAADQRVAIVERDVSLAVAASDARRGMWASPVPSRDGILLHLALPARAPVQVSIHDLQGRRVRSFEAGTLDPGMHTIHFDGRDARGRPLAPGVYLARVHGPTPPAAVRLVLIGR